MLRGAEIYELLAFGLQQVEDIGELLTDGSIAAPTPTGDYNGNGLVEQGDLNLVLLNWGSELIDPTGTGWLTDLPTGLIDQEELDKVLLGWGNSAALGAGVGGIPERRTGLLAVFAVAAVLLHAQRPIAWQKKKLECEPHTGNGGRFTGTWGD